MTRLKSIDFIGMDLVEVAPAYHVDEISALAGASMVSIYMSLLVERGVGLKAGSPTHDDHRHGLDCRLRGADPDPDSNDCRRIGE